GANQDQQFQKFSLTGFDAKGKAFWKLEGDVANIDPGQSVFLDKNVTLKFRDSTIVRTDHVSWSPNGQVMSTDALVTVDHENVTARGTGAYGKPAENFIQLNRMIEMVINQTTRLVCDGPLKIYYNDNKMVFYRNVVVTDAKGTLSANRMDVLFDPQERKVQRIIAVGNVIIQRDADRTQSQRAIYNVADSSIRLEGNPQITLHKSTAGMLNGITSGARS
ncbi:MAG: LPS export ABC transporter periplasmic protein LptC, partial [Candidatus Omnitrophota bacterium]